jgi:hypothetical protein
VPSRQQACCYSRVSQIAFERPTQTRPQATVRGEGVFGAHSAAGSRADMTYGCAPAFMSGTRSTLEAYVLRVGASGGRPNADAVMRGHGTKTGTKTSRSPERGRIASAGEESCGRGIRSAR